MIGAVFGVASVVWAGWAQETPPTHWVWRLVLAVFAVGGVALAALTVTVPARQIARSFWCGVLGAPVFFGIGVWSAVAARTTFGQI